MILLDELLFDDDGNVEEVFAHNLGEDRHQPVDDLDYILGFQDVSNSAANCKRKWNGTRQEPRTCRHVNYQLKQ